MFRIMSSGVESHKVGVRLLLQNTVRLRMAGCVSFPRLPGKQFNRLFENVIQYIKKKLRLIAGEHLFPFLFSGCEIDEGWPELESHIIRDEGVRLQKCVATRTRFFHAVRQQCQTQGKNHQITLKRNLRFS